MKLQKQQEIIFIYHAGKHVQMRAFNRWEGICIEISFCCILRLISLKIKCGNTDDTYMYGSYEVVSTEKTFLSRHDVTHCDYHIPFCCSGSRSIWNIQKPDVER